MNKRVYKILSIVLIVLGLIAICFGVYKFVLSDDDENSGNNTNTNTNNGTDIEKLPVVEIPITNHEAKNIVEEKYDELSKFLDSKTGFGGLSTTDVKEITLNNKKTAKFNYASKFKETFENIFTSDVKYNMVFGEVGGDKKVTFDGVDNGDNYYSYTVIDDKYYVNNACNGESDYLEIDFKNGDISFGENYETILYLISIYDTGGKERVLVRTGAIELHQENKEWKIFRAVIQGNCDRVLYINQFK